MSIYYHYLTDLVFLTMLFQGYTDILFITGHFKDNEITHFASSFGAGTCATLLSQPIDVFKTRLMNAKPGEFNSFGALVKFTAQSGIKGFYKGFVPGIERENTEDS